MLILSQDKNVIINMDQMIGVQLSDSATYVKDTNTGTLSKQTALSVIMPDGKIIKLAEYTTYEKATTVRDSILSSYKSGAKTMTLPEEK
nr:MAG TPA: hypothetical protein [Caudoviricetes sp.]